MIQLKSRARDRADGARAGRSSRATVAHAARAGAAGHVDAGARRDGRGRSSAATRARRRRSRGCTAFPARICASINQEIVHGIPSKKRVLQEGDIISLDVGVRLQGLLHRLGDHGRRRRGRCDVADGCSTVTQRALEAGIAAAVIGQSHRRHRRGGAGGGRGRGLQRGARSRGARHRRGVPRGAAGAELRQAEAP